MKKLLTAMFVALLMAGCGVHPDIICQSWGGCFLFPGPPLADLPPMPDYGGEVTRALGGAAEDILSGLVENAEALLLLVVIVGILAILALVLLAFTVRCCLKSYPTAAAGKVIWIFVMFFFFPFGSALYLLAYFLSDRNDQGSLDGNREEGDFLVECLQCGEGILRNVESCTNCGEVRPVE